MRTSYRQTPNARADGQPLGQRYSLDYHIPELAQISTITLADGTPAAAEAWILSATDDETGQIWTLAITSGASLALSLDAAVAAVAGDGKFNDLFTATEDDATVLTLTARHVGRGYTIALDTSAGSATSTIALAQAPGGNKLAFGRLLARTGERTAGQLSAASTTRDLAGVLFRTDYNHTRPFAVADQRAGSDGLERGKTVSLMRRGVVCVVPEAGAVPVSVDDPVYVRRAQTASAGDLGAFRASEGGGQQSYTFTPSAVDLPAYGFEFDYGGAHYTALYLGDDTTTVAVACDGLVQDLGSIAGLTITDGGTEVTIQTAAGTSLANVRNLASHTDVPADSVAIAESVAADVDTIDITSVARWVRLPDAQGIAELSIDLGA